MKTSESERWGRQLAHALQNVKIVGHIVQKGGAGSGHYGHAGRPGAVGGSVVGGVLIGRKDAPDAEEQFKFSGKATLSRPQGPHVEVSVGSKKGGRLEIHGEADSAGKALKNTAVLRVGGQAVRVDHDELHAIRSKIHFLQSANEQKLKNVARGTSMTVQVGNRKVDVPISKKTVETIDRAVKATKDKGYSLAAEGRTAIRGAVKSMTKDNPIRVCKDLRFSKAGTFAAFRTHVERPKDKDVTKMADDRKSGKGKAGKKLIDTNLWNFMAMRAEGRKAFKELSGTQAIRSYRDAAVYLTHLGRK
jgi:hypothetical protein